MKKYLSLLVLCLFVMPAFGAGRSMVGNVRPGVGAGVARTVASEKTNVATPVVPVAQKVAKSAVVAQDNNNANEKQEAPKAAIKTAQEQARMACLSNNIGIGNTFVWASRNSNTSSYATMVEDTENPDNNVCFVLVGMRSEDARVNTADIQPRYFEWGRNITCGSWVDEEKLKDRILEAKKKARVWGTIGASVGGAGLGFGMMEAFGNKLLAKSSGLKDLEGQRALEGAEWYQSKAYELYNKGGDSRNTAVEFKRLVDELKKVCSDSDAVSEVKEKCQQEDYKILQQVKLDF